MLFGCRHGERADRCPKEMKTMELSFDPHLTAVGCSQAKATGQRIAKEIENYHLHLQEQGLVSKDSPNEIEAIVVVSPFLRTLMTAFNLAEQLPRIYKNTIFQQYEFSEYIATWDFDEDPMPNLFVKNRDWEQELQKKYIPQMQKIQLGDQLFDNKKSWTPVFPEKDNRNRVFNAVQGLADYYVNNFDTTKYVMIYVTHQSIVEEGLRYYKINIPQWSLDYCALSQVLFPEAKKQNTKDYKVLIKGDSNHIKGINK